jgi:hypothetical protein
MSTNSVGPDIRKFKSMKLSYSPTKEEVIYNQQAYQEQQEILRSKTFINPKTNKRYAETKIKPPTQTSNRSFQRGPSMSSQEGEDSEETENIKL